MIVFIPLSSLVFTILLIAATLNDSPDRLWFKLMACAHFVVLGLGAFVYADPTTREYGILLGLVLSFLGDLFLALRRRSKNYFVLGIAFFTLAQFAYLSIYPWTSFQYPVFVIAFTLQILTLWAFGQKGVLELPHKILPFLILYDLALVAMVSFTSGLYSFEPNPVTLLRLVSSSAFFLSDSILFMVYFIKPKKKARVVAYLLLYHFAQTLIALSLWY